MRQLSHPSLVFRDMSKKPKFKIGDKVTDIDCEDGSGLWDYVKEVHTVKYKKNGKIQTRFEYACGFGRNSIGWITYSEEYMKKYGK